MSTLRTSLLVLLLAACGAPAPEVDVELWVDFSQPLREWDGFGVNYVEARHTRDYQVFPQDYGGFKYLDDAERERVIEMTFGEDGLQGRRVLARRPRRSRPARAHPSRPDHRRDDDLGAIRRVHHAR